MKKAIRLVLPLLLIVSVMLTACQSQQASTNQKDQKIKDNAQLTKPGTLPIVKKKVTLTVATPQKLGVKDFKTNQFTKWFEKKTNVHIKWEVVPSQSAQKKFNLILASGNLPDVFMDMPVTKSQLMVYGNQGTFLSLNQLIQKNGVEIKKVFQKMPNVKKAITAPNGKIYALPGINDCFHCSMSQKMWIYKPWLKKLGLKMPTTTQQLYHVLKAFKTQDPNGNGKADEVPFAGDPKNLWHGEIAGFLMEPFIYSDMFVKNGKIVVPFNKPQWKKGLEYIHKLYAQGLISSNSFTSTREQDTSLGNHPGKPILGSFVTATRSGFVDIHSKRGLNYVAVPPLKGPSGRRVSWYSPSAIVPAQYIITKACKYPKVALRLADAMYRHDVTMRAYFGIKGKNWRPAKKGEIGLNGKPAKYTVLKDVYANQPQNIAWSQEGITNRPRQLRSSKATAPDSQEAVLWKATEKYVPYKPKKVKSVPPLFFTEKQSQQLGTLDQTINNYVKEMTAKFITGNVSINKGWNQYLQTLKNMGVKKYVAIYQKAYDAKYK